MAAETKHAMSDSDRLLEYQRALGNFSRLASETMPASQLLQHACGAVSAVTGIRHVKILRYRRDHADLLIEAGVGWKDGVVGVVSMNIDNASPPGRTLQTGAVVAVEDMNAQTEFRHSRLLQDHGIVSLLNAPIRQDGAIWGVLEVDSEHPRRFDDIDTGFLTSYANVVGICMQRIQAEESAADVRAQCVRQASAFEVEIRELYHRTRNNLQVINSFLSLQRRDASEDARERLTKAMNRVQTIALAHDQLSLRRTGRIEFGEYLRALCANIDPQQDEVQIDVTATPGVTLPLDRAVPAGLIVNELVTNALKYAFPDRAQGRIWVTFEMKEERAEATLAVEDNGGGMRGQTTGSGLGLKLVRAFADQIGGTVELGSPPEGVLVSVRFPVP
jgi:two-component sensor histidine kinase